MAAIFPYFPAFGDLTEMDRFCSELTAICRMADASLPPPC
jgi:hypothetical protein